ncbi:hypothetical protein [Streptomyces sp. NBC_00996]|uniref:hypothetical protein n=1 Tax=Streptomyces sp. NBC_00996 TaxID=2903710 RepID=UPI00386C3C7E|nr:hypothetical protein OG390_44150 [Streptomyces sp. NBC_00996]
MNDEAKTRIAQALERGEDNDALQALRWSLVWSAQAVARLARTGSDTAPVEAVFLLDDALTEVVGLARAVTELLAVAEPGSEVEAYLQDRQSELAETRRRTEACRREHEGLANTESELRARLAELDAVRGQVAELRRLERLVEALDEIEAQRGLVEERLVLLRDCANGTEDAVRLGSADLLRLTEDQLSRLAGPVRDTLKRSSEAQGRLAAAEAELADAERAAAEALASHAEYRERLAELDAYARADRRLVDVLARFADAARPVGADDSGTDDSLERAGTVIDDIEARLHDVDTALSRALGARDRPAGPGRTVITWNDEGPGPHPLR